MNDKDKENDTMKRSADYPNINIEREEFAKEHEQRIFITQDEDSIKEEK